MARRTLHTCQMHVSLDPPIGIPVMVRIQDHTLFVGVKPKGAFDEEYVP